MFHLLLKSRWLYVWLIAASQQTRRIFFSPLYLRLLITVLMVASCGAHEKETSSETAGLWTPFADAMSSTKPKPAAFLEEAEDVLGKAVEKIGTTLRRNASAPASMSTLLASARDQLSAGYVQAMISVGGVPRSQGEAILKKVLAKDSIACGGASCTQVFGVDDELVSPFMNQTLVKASLSPSLSLPENVAQKLTVLESLKPDLALPHVDSFVKGIATASSKPPVSLPKGIEPPKPLEVLSAQAIEKAAGQNFLSTVQSYTLTSFR